MARLEDIRGAGLGLKRELIPALQAGVPAVFVPAVGVGDLLPSDEDELARARFAAAAGVARCVEPGGSLPMLPFPVRFADFGNGAIEAASLIAARCLEQAAA